MVTVMELALAYQDGVVQILITFACIHLIALHRPHRPHLRSLVAIIFLIAVSFVRNVLVLVTLHVRYAPGLAAITSFIMTAQQISVVLAVYMRPPLTPLVTILSPDLHRIRTSNSYTTTIIGRARDRDVNDWISSSILVCATTILYWMIRVWTASDGESPLPGGIVRVMLSLACMLFALKGTMEHFSENDFRRVIRKYYSGNLVVLCVLVGMYGGWILCEAVFDFAGTAFYLVAWRDKETVQGADRGDVIQEPWVFALCSMYVTAWALEWTLVHQAIKWGIRVPGRTASNGTLSRMGHSPRGNERAVDVDGTVSELELEETTTVNRGEVTLQALGNDAKVRSDIPDSPITLNDQASDYMDGPRVSTSQTATARPSLAEELFGRRRSSTLDTPIRPRSKTSEDGNQLLKGFYQEFAETRPSPLQLLAVSEARASDVSSTRSSTRLRVLTRSSSVASSANVRSMHSVPEDDDSDTKSEASIMSPVPPVHRASSPPPRPVSPLSISLTSALRERTRINIGSLGSLDLKEFGGSGVEEQEEEED